MENSLDIGLSEFQRMNSQDRDTLIYNNLVHIRKKTLDYKFNMKLQYIWLVVLTTVFSVKKYVWFLN